MIFGYRFFIFLLSAFLVVFIGFGCVVAGAGEVVMGDVSSSDISVRHDVVGVGGSFDFGNCPYLVRDYSGDDVCFIVRVDISNLNDSSRKSLDRLVDSGFDGSPVFILRDDVCSEFLRTGSDCNLSVEGNLIVISGVVKRDFFNHRVVLDNCEVVGVLLNYGDCSSLGLSEFVSSDYDRLAGSVC